MQLPERYEILRHIASGGMASVWCARDLVLGRSVAIKLLADQFADDERSVRRFKREARAAAKLSGHQHVVTIYDVGEVAPGDDAAANSIGRAFIVMEHLAGGTVADALRVGEVRRDEALRWIGEAACALDYAHEEGVVHRDIKPGNFLLDRARVLHVGDFGIARLGSEDTITGSGQLFGTAAYLSPEQACGKSATEASDRYALAVAAYELLVGERPFAAEHFAAQARQHIEDERPRASRHNRTLLSDVDPVLARGMAKEPGDRWPTAAAFADALGEALARDRHGAPTRMFGAARRSGAAAIPAARSRAAAATPAARPRAAAATPAARSRAAAATPAARAGSAAPPPLLLQGSTRASAARPGRIIALGALAAAALVVGLLTGQSQDPSSAVKNASVAKRTAPTRTAPVTRTTHAAPKPTTHRSTATTSTQATTSAAAPTTAAPAVPVSADSLEARGHELMLNGDYGAAVTTLRRAIASASPSSLTFAYALYDLGRSLLLSGDPQAAVPVLEQRLQIPNQTGVVRQTLDMALRASGQSAPGAGAPGASHAGRGHGDHGGQGGQGGPPGQGD